MNAPLEIYAGPKALNTIQKEGFSPTLFRYFLGASGGPKWFVLAGLDRVIFPEFFGNAKQKLEVIGSSAGAFRAACLVQHDSTAAINRLATHYSTTTYSMRPTAAEISSKAKLLLDDVMGEQGVSQALSNDRFNLHIFVARCMGIMAKESKASQSLGCLLSAGINAISRKNLEWFYSRYVFSAQPKRLSVHDPYNLKTHWIGLNKQNFKASLLASGAIPIVLEGVKDIVAAPSGIYRDGGILDYHFDLVFGPEEGLVLYPHFYPNAIPGWFDKMLGARRPHCASYDNVVMLVPSVSFVDSLPYKKIPDRKDFEKMDADQRIRYWTQVLKETDRLGEYFLDLMHKEQLHLAVKPLPFACRN